MIQPQITKEFTPCMECDRPGTVKIVLLGFNQGVEVTRKGTGELVGYLHANCNDVWLTKNDGSKFSFRAV